MKIERDTDKYDLARMIAGALYMGMFTNILIPALVLLGAYFLDERGLIDNSVGRLANALFYFFAVLSIVEAGVALVWRNKSLNSPMITKVGRIEEDIRNALLKRLRPVFFVIAAIALNGIVYFLLTARFEEGLLFVVFSFLVFQVVRPRYGSLRKLVQQQEEMFEQGQFAQE